MTADNAPGADLPRVLPIDAAAIRRYGLERWCRDFPCPIAAADFAAFVQSLFDGLEQVFASVGHREQEALLATSDFIIAMRDILYADALKAWRHDHEHTLDMAPAASAAFAPDFVALSKLYTAHASTPQLAVRAAARSWVENRPLGRLAQIKATAGVPSRGLDWSIGTMGGLKRDEIARLGNPVRTVYADTLVGKALARAKPLHMPQLEAALDAFASSLRRQLSSSLGRGLSAPLFSVTELVAAWKARCETARGVMDGLKELIQSPPQRLHLNEVWKANHRAVAFTLRNMGTDVISYSHGNDPMIVLQPQHAFMAYPHNTTYVCETPASAAAHAAHYTNAVPAKSFPVRFRSAAKTPAYHELGSQRSVAPASTRVRVMVMGYPMLPHRTQFDVTNGLAMHLEGERRILALLRASGLCAQYKAHPETRNDALGLFEDVADEVIFEPFEQVLDRTDIVVFLTTVSSTFGAALCTRKPVVVLDHAGKNWNPMLKDLISRRCRLVPSWIGPDNRISFEISNFLAALTLPGPAPDLQIIEDVFSTKAWAGPSMIEQRSSRSILSPDPVRQA